MQPDKSDSRRVSITLGPATLLMTWAIAYSMGKAAGYVEAERIICSAAARAYSGISGR